MGVKKRTVGSQRESTLSLMPQELEKSMSKQELADLLGYLRGEN